MKAHYRTANGRITFEVQAETVKALFKEIAGIQEVFDADTDCGCCKSSAIHFQARQVDNYDFYELVCLDCRARFQFGQAKKGGALFPKRKDEDGKLLPNRGWSKFVPKGEAAAAPGYRDDEEPWARNQ